VAIWYLPCHLLLAFPQEHIRNFSMQKVLDSAYIDAEVTVSVVLEGSRTASVMNDQSTFVTRGEVWNKDSSSASDK
jgi:hypothetical protein